MNTQIRKVDVTEAAPVSGTKKVQTQFLIPEQTKNPKILLQVGSYLELTEKLPRISFFVPNEILKFFLDHRNQKIKFLAWFAITLLHNKLMKEEKPQETTNVEKIPEEVLLNENSTSSKLLLSASKLDPTITLASIGKLVQVRMSYLIHQKEVLD
jgi:hypothetical protein